MVSNQHTYGFKQHVALWLASLPGKHGATSQRLLDITAPPVHSAAHQKPDCCAPVQLCDTTLLRPPPPSMKNWYHTCVV